MSRNTDVIYRCVDVPHDLVYVEDAGSACFLLGTRGNGMSRIISSLGESSREMAS